MMQRFSLGSFVAGVILGALLAGAWFVGGNPELFSTRPSTDESTQTSKSGIVSVADQRAGLEVVVESVNVPSPGVWVAVRETVGSDLGNVLGAARVGGPRTGISVTLLRATEPNRSYAVELYRDDNEGVFDAATNSVYIDFDTSASVVAYFKTTE